MATRKTPQEWIDADAWARAKWGSRVNAVNYKRAGLYEVALDGPPRTGEKHLIHRSEEGWIELPPIKDGRRERHRAPPTGSEE